ncbi:MAG: hypothetical protein JSW20_01745 [Nitrospiraceae bacterium]|nr:MAG: hypothetical protein JSW20_01745 [Nitrospiraceae bacterium]
MKNLFLKILLLSGIPFGLLTGIFSLLHGEMKDAIINAVLSGLMFGTLTAYILISLHKSLSRKVMAGTSMHDYGIHQVRHVTTGMPYEQAFSLCIQSLKTIHRCHIISQSRDTGEIRAATGINWKTWSDEIYFRLTGNEEMTEIEVSSRPSAKSTFVDFGKNLDNVERITRFLRSSKKADHSEK